MVDIASKFDFIKSLYVKLFLNIKDLVNALKKLHPPNILFKIN